MAPTLVDVPGIGGDRAGALAEHGIRTPEQLAEANVDRIAAVPGFGPVSARRAQEAARKLVAGSAQGEKGGKKSRKEDKDKSPKKSGKRAKGGKKGKDKSGKKSKKKKQKTKKTKKKRKK